MTFFAAAQRMTTAEPPVAVMVSAFSFLFHNNSLRELSALAARQLYYLFILCNLWCPILHKPLAISHQHAKRFRVFCG